MGSDGARVRCPRCSAADALILFRHEVACQNMFCPLYAPDLKTSAEEERRRATATEAWRRMATLPDPYGGGP